jgi:hypothetical protein
MAGAERFAWPRTPPRAKPSLARECRPIPAQFAVGSVSA